MNSRFETVAGELRARLLRRRGLATIPVAAGTAPVTWHCTRYVAMHPLRGDAPVTWHCTRYVAMHPLRDDAPVTWRCTRSERVQCLRIGCTAQRSNTPKKSLPPRTHHPQTGTHEATRPPSTAGVEGTGGSGGPGCGARGRWRGLAGLRDNAPSEARGADVSRAGLRHPEHQWGHKHPG